MKRFLSTFRLFVILPLLIALSGAAAQAQSLPMLETCVARFGGADGTADACTRQLYDSCLATKPGETTLDMAECMQQTLGAWDAYLNKLWKPMKARAKANGTWDSLLASQRQWLAYRDAECERVYNEFRGGSLRLVAAPECHANLTAQKTMEFYRTLQR